MAQRPLRGIAFDPAVSSTLTKHKFTTSKDVLSLSLVELIHDLDLPLPVVADVVRLVSIKVAPKPLTVMQLLNKKHNGEAESTTLITSLPLLDAYLRGGLPPASLTEIVGPAGVGKTQFCHMITATALLPRNLGGSLPWRSFGDDTGVFYFDTEGAFSSNRLAEILSQKNPHFLENSESLLSTTKRVTRYRIDRSVDMIETLNNIESVLIDCNVKLIVVDSIANLVRDEFDKTSLAKRQKMLSKIAARLKEIAESFQIPVLITNQVATRGQGNSQLTAALGTLWSHAINTRLVLEYTDGNRFLNEDVDLDPSVFPKLRQIVIGKSPVAPVVAFPYFIDDRGLNLVKRRTAGSAMDLEEEDDVDAYVAEISPWNYWDKSIAASNPTTLNRQ